MELNLARDVKDNKKGFDKHRGDERKPRMKHLYTALISLHKELFAVLPLFFTDEDGSYGFIVLTLPDQQSLSESLHLLMDLDSGLNLSHSFSALHLWL
ncbi:hypothetical protein AV530_010110 [Patagioenas fasciata monilis]|uniref:Uncharacterized protein n=1 Tax=Patagioenas fasciata monilis TaxID=372326 RepID=A0A1V4L0Y9_PATFA|nr:hypothetical protein AV530_010110 [Patagioenas fasciata monilis]